MVMPTERPALAAAAGLAVSRDRPRLDRADPRALARRRHHDLVADRDAAALDAAGDDAAVVELVDRLHRKPQRQRARGLGRREPVERFDDGRAGVPRDRRRPRDDAVAVARRNRDDRGRLHAEALEMRADLGVELAKPAVVVAHPVHLVDDDDDLAHAEQVQQVAVPPRLLAHAFGGVDDQQRRIGLGRAGDHVAQELGVAGRIDQDEIARRRAEAHLAGVDGDALVALGLQRIEQERQFEGHAAPRAHRLELVELAVGQAAGFGEQAADQGRLAVIDMADDDDADERDGPRRWQRDRGSGETRAFMRSFL